MVNPYDPTFLKEWTMADKNKIVLLEGNTDRKMRLEDDYMEEHQFQGAKDPNRWHKKVDLKKTGDAIKNIHKQLDAMNDHLGNLLKDYESREPDNEYKENNIKLLKKWTKLKGETNEDE